MNTLSSILKFIAENIAPIVGTHSGNTVLAAPNGSTGVPTFRSLGASDIPNVVRPPIGSMSMYAGSSAPSGWLLCNGQAVSRTTYSALYSIIGTTYGSGNGSTTFNLPDLRDRVAVGAGTNYSRNTKGGANSISYTPAGTNGGGSVGGHLLTAAESGNQAQTASTGWIAGGASAISGEVYVRKAGATTDTLWSPSGAFSVGSGSGDAAQYTPSSSRSIPQTLNISASTEHWHYVSIAAQNASSSHNHPFTQPTFTGRGATLDVRQPYFGIYFIIYSGVA